MHLVDWAERIDLGKEIQEVYLHSFLFKLAVKLVGIFLPLYILERGFSVETVFLFFLAYSGTYVVGSLPNAEIASKIGYKHTSLLASPMILVFYLLLRSVETQPSLILVAILGGLGFNMYWTGMNPEVARSSHSEKREEETGFFFSMPALSSVISPVVGGLILAVSGFNVLFAVAALLIAASFIPFLFSREHHSGMNISPLEFAREEMDLNDFLTFLFKGGPSQGKKVLWPLYLALVIKGSISIGGAGGFMAFGGVVTSIFIGKITNDGNRKKVILAGTSIASASYILMSFITEPVTAFAVSMLNGLSFTAISIPVYSKAMEHSEKEDIIEYFAFREIALSVGRIATLLTLLAVFKLTRFKFILGFLFIAATVVAAGYFGSRMD